MQFFIRTIEITTAFLFLPSVKYVLIVLFFVFNSSNTPSQQTRICMRLLFSLASGSAPTEDSYLSLFCDFRISMVWFCGFFAASGMGSG
jgi:hypothetical protein